MKAKSFQIQALKSQLDHGYDAVVLYGTDEGEINHALSILKQELGLTGKSAALFTLSKEALKKTPFLATDEANTSSLIAERRFLFVPEDASFSAAALTHFLDNKRTDALLIIQAGNLIKSNALRVEAEKNPRVLAIACYQPTLSDIQKTISNFFIQNHKKISSSVLTELCQKIPFNQDVIDQELNKILIYMGDQNEVDSATLQACLSNSAEASLDQLCIDLADGYTENVQRQITLFLASGESETSLLRAVRTYFETLLSILSDDSSYTLETIKKYLKPSQFRLEDPLLRQAKKWNQHAVLSVLHKLSLLEQRTRTTAIPVDTVIGQAFLNLALFSKKLS